MVSQRLSLLQSNFERCRTVWYNHLDTTEETEQENSEILAVNPPEFTIITLVTLESIIAHSGRVDRDWFNSVGKFHLPEGRKEAPSTQRKNYGLLFDILDDKFLRKPIMQEMLRDRWSVNCIPINLKHNLAPYDQYNLFFIIQKATWHLSVEKKGAEKFSAD